MQTIEKIIESLPDAAKDIRINLQNVLQPGTLSVNQMWGVAAASAYAIRNANLLSAVLSAAKEASVPAETLEDAKASAILMGMNNIYYRFRHMIDKENYSQKPARLRMSRLVQTAADKIEFELYSLAVSAINGCESCLKSHEKVVLEGGLSDDHVHDSVRIAATLHAAAVALESLDG